MTDEEIREYFPLMNINAYCCKCLNFKPDVYKLPGENGTVTNWIFCAKQDTCSFSRKFLEELYGK